MITGTNRQELLDFETQLQTKVNKVSIKGDAQEFLGMEISRNRDQKSITLRQTQFIGDALHSEGLSEASTKPSPAASTIDLNKAPKGDPEKPTPMREIVGRIRYAVDHTCPEALFIASQLSSAASNAGPEHFSAAESCLRYMKGAASTGLTLGGRESISPQIFVDASYIEEGDARSQCGLCVRLNSESGMIYSRSYKDTSVSLSSAEAELRALKEAAQEALWLRYFLRELGYPIDSPIPIYEDNQAVVNLIDTLKLCPRTRHLNKIREFIIEKALEGKIKVFKIAGEFNVADILTKALDTTRFLMLRAKLLGEALK